MKGSLSTTALYMIITYSMNLQWINSLVTVFGKLEQQVLQIEALRQIDEIPQEKSEGITPENWPTDCKIEFHHAHARQRDEHFRVLKDVSFVAEKDSFLGICGPSGAGISLIANVLTRLIEL